MPRRISRRVQRQFDVLRRATRWPVWADLATRLGVAFLLIGVVVLVHWSDRAGLQDSYDGHVGRSEEDTSELQTLMRISYADFCLKKNKQLHANTETNKTCRNHEPARHY